MQTLISRGRRAARPGLLAALVLATLACYGTGSEPAAPPSASYRVRGVVRQVEHRPGGLTRLLIHHEAIPEFVNIHGEVEAMQAMTMPFAVDDGVSLKSIAVGSKIRFELMVDWSVAEPAWITALELLPAETILSFETTD